MPRLNTEKEAAALVGPGVRICLVRLPQVHDQNKQGLVTYLVDIARAKGVSAYVGDGMNRWSAAHLSDTARLYRLALDKGSAGCYHAVAEEGVPVRDIAEVIGRRLKLPVVAKTPAEAAEHFGTMGGFAALDGAASSALTRERLGWRPVGPGLIADLERAHNLEI
jgi:nucleoside-diphosphate-sugar epimerase